MKIYIPVHDGGNNEESDEIVKFKKGCNKPKIDCYTDVSGNTLRYRCSVRGNPPLGAAPRVIFKSPDT